MPLEQLGFILGTSFASGLNLYATIVVAGLLGRSGVVTLPPALEILANPIVLGIAGALFVIEFLADKIPWVDSAWDAIHTFIRPPAAAVIAVGAVGGLDQSWALAAGLLAGTVALTSHGAKASTRAAANTSPEPVSNWTLSFAEDAIAVLLTWLATTHPIVTGAIVLVLLVLAVLLIRMIVRTARSMRAKLALLFRRGRPTPQGPE